MKKISLKFYLRFTHPYIEILIIKIKKFFGYAPDISVIPQGHYCYEIDIERNIKEPINGYWTIKCPYYRYIGGMSSACTFLGFIGCDLVHWDQCKICDTNIEYDKN